MISVTKRRVNGGLVEHTVNGINVLANPAELSRVMARSTRPKLRPGDILSLVIKKITGETPGPNCSCNAKKRQINAWGWWGCWRKRKTIGKWLAEEAAKRGHALAEANIFALFKAALKESKAAWPRINTDFHG